MRPGFTTATHSSGLPLPLPIRVSAGFFVTGLSGKILIQTLPPRLRLRVRATRAASIWRFVTQPGSSALRPYSPKARVEPRWALPRMRPRWAFRYLTRLGISMDGPLGLRGRLGEHLALEDPDLHADRPVRRVGGGGPEVDVGAQRVQRHPTVAIPLAPRDLGAAQAPGARDADTVGAQPQRRGHGLFHGAAKRHALLQLQCHVLGHELGVELGMDDLLDVEVDLLLRPRLQLVLEPLHLGALAADDDPRPRRRHGDPGAIRRALDIDPGDPGVIELVLDVAPDLHVLVQQLRVVLGREPPRRPRPRDAQANADRMCLLAHYLFPLPAPRFEAAALPPPRGAFVRAAGFASGVSAAAAGRAAGGRARSGAGARRAPLTSSLTATIRWLVRCLMKNARPIARGCTRLRDGPPSAVACTTRRSSRFRT